jgi:transcriptional regulator with XRE-family HTH domain
MKANPGLIAEATHDPSRVREDFCEIGHRIKYFRAQLGCSQRELAGKLNISQGYLSAVERGADKVNVNILVGLAFLHPTLKADWLLTGRGEMTLATSTEICPDRIGSGTSVDLSLIPAPQLD